MANLQSIFPKAINTYGEKHDPMQNLWRNVLIVALEDAIGLHYKNKNYGISRSGGAKLAQSYFTEPNSDFKLVCTYAGFDHEYIRMKVKQYFEKKRKENEQEDMSAMQGQWLYQSN
jgi:hypothetical protein